MVQLAACIRCHGTDLATARFEHQPGLTIAVDEAHASAVVARVCLACGAVMFTATSPGALRVGDAPDDDVQEYDF